LGLLAERFILDLDRTFVDNLGAIEHKRSIRRDREAGLLRVEIFAACDHSLTGQASDFERDYSAIISSRCSVSEDDLDDARVGCPHWECSRSRIANDHLHLHRLSATRERMQEQCQ